MTIDKLSDDRTDALVWDRSYELSLIYMRKAIRTRKYRDAWAWARAAFCAKHRARSE